MEELMGYVMQQRYLLTGIATAFMGCAVRMSHNREVESPTLKAVIGYYSTGFFLAYLVYSTLTLLGYEKSTGLFCAIAGVLSKEVMGFIIHDVPKILPIVFKKWIFKKLGIEEDNHKNDKI